MDLNFYLNFNGDCQEAFKFYEKALGGKIEMVFPYEGSPMAEQVPAEWRSKVMHARMTIGNYTLMGSDAAPSCYSKPTGYAINIAVKTAVEAEKFFAALSDGAQIGMPIAETFWAIRFGMLTDKFGVPWMVNAEKQM
jgi:PhnB protein